MTYILLFILIAALIVGALPNWPQKSVVEKRLRFGMWLVLGVVALLIAASLG